MSNSSENEANWTEFHGTKFYFMEFVFIFLFLSLVPFCKMNLVYLLDMKEDTFRKYNFCHIGYCFFIHGFLFVAIVTV